MKNRTIFVLVNAVGLTLVALMLAVMSAWAAPNEQGPVAAASAVSSIISYQGRLLDSSSNPVSGTRTITFRLYTQATGGTALWSQTSTVTVNDGYFSANLGVDSTDFDGQALFLGVQVASDPEMTPRQPVLPAPYALSLRPGAIISGNSSIAPTIAVGNLSGQAIWSSGNSSSPTIYAENLTGIAGYFTSTNSIGIHAGTISTGLNDPAIVGENLGSGPGILGLSLNNAAGVFNSTNGHGLNVGGAGLDGLRINNTVSGNYISAGSDTDLDFRVTNNGTVYADGSYNCGLGSGCFNTGTGADVAERIDVSETLEPGDVVEIDPDNPGYFRLSRSTYSTLVAGIVSTNPAITMNNNDLANNEAGVRTDDRPLLALVGQVPVKASAENGPITPGDLLVASATPGHAMKAGPNPAPGTILGKALEPLATNSGIILVLVTLQ